MEVNRVLNPKQKALQVNLDKRIYGSFSEIGAGQEVARFFFQAGGAAGTIAKSMSAYDMVMSDEIYGKEKDGRYVSEPRLVKMLSHEYEILVSRLSEKRGKETCFFSFADTVAAKSFKGTTHNHGWIGLQFQHAPGAPVSQLSLHITMHDNQNVLQQQAIGVFGVNLIHACFYLLKNTDEFVNALMDNLTTERIKIDTIRVQGPAFSHMNERLLCLELVKKNYTEAVLFDADGAVLQPMDAFYKKNILVLRGSFRPPTLVNLDMMESGLKIFQKNLPTNEQNDILVVGEMSMNKLRERGGDVDNQDFLSRVDLLGALGKQVLITNSESFHSLSGYLHSITNKSIGFVVGVHNLEEILTEKTYSCENDQCNIFTGLGEMFGTRGTLYVYPALKEKSTEVIGAKDIKLEEKALGILEYLMSRKLVQDVPEYNKNVFNIWSRTVLEMIENCEEGWEKMVPDLVAKEVKKRQLFGHCKIK